MRALVYEYLNPDDILPRESFRFVWDFLKRTRRTQIGWHYAIDLAWIHSVVSHWPRPARILDAGGGRGPAQYLLAEMGFDIVNVDLFHAMPTDGAWSRYSMRRSEFGAQVEDEYVRHLLEQQSGWSANGLVLHLRRSGALQNFRARMFERRHARWRASARLTGRPGSIELAQGNLCSMPQFAASTFDGVVSLSAVEHIPADRIRRALDEIDRVLRPDAGVAITTSASADTDSWFHAPSKGLCFSAEDLASIFNASPSDPISPRIVLERYRENAFLRRNLARFYSRSANNGMPWGRWDPQYISVSLRR